ncbi:hypothetical protein SteCoe_37105 [Stentor coeruleus]|uniref:Uncharacterized protein n=1 Tax=Stentor coeruleus TaxID=5963 RepID=A0A1R2ANS2_9CILI|nr:hypothetical protein SteCoe_37105 [Stentor coeruleus]
MSLSYFTDPGLYIISDTFQTDGTGLLLSLLKSFKKKIAFISDPGHYSHFNTLFKKNSLHVIYYELCTNNDDLDLPLTEDPPSTWLDPSRRIKPNQVFTDLSKSPQPVIVLEEILSLYLSLGIHEFISLVNSLRAICEILIIKCDSQLLQRIWMIESTCDGILEVLPLQSGFSSDFAGKVHIWKKENYVRMEVAVLWYKISNDNFVLVE